MDSESGETRVGIPRVSFLVGNRFVDICNTIPGLLIFLNGLVIFLNRQELCDKP